MLEKNKCKCKECNWKGFYEDVLKAPSPFDKNDEIYGCPICKVVNEIEPICEHPSCWRTATNGGPVDGEYKSACFEHGWCNPNRDKESE